MSSQSDRCSQGVMKNEESKRQYNKPSEVAFVLFETEIK
jgi:hypothetical protein